MNKIKNPLNPLAYCFITRNINVRRAIIERSLSLSYHKHYSSHSISNSLTERMMHYCAHCNYKSQAKSNVKRHQSFKHQSFKHNSTYDEVVEHPLLKQMDEKPMDLDLMEDSIEVFKIYKLLQRMKNK